MVKSALRVSVQCVVELEDRPSTPVGRPIGIDMGIRNRAIMSSGETVPAVTIDRRPLKRVQRLMSRAKKGSASRRKNRTSRGAKRIFPAASSPKCNTSQRGAKPERRRSLHEEA